MAEINARSQFKLISILQRDCAFDGAGDAPHPNTFWWHLEKNSNDVVSDVQETLFNAQKNSKIMRDGKHYRKPQSSMGIALSRTVIEDGFDFKAVETSVPVLQ